MASSTPAASDGGHDIHPADNSELFRPMFSHSDIQRIKAETFVERVESHSELPSTNDHAIQLAREPSSLAVCTLILVEKQTAGRGRGKNTWWSEAGALTFSLLMDGKKLALPVSRWPLLSLTTGLAVCGAIDDQLAEKNTQLKWPNDVYLQGRKVCGILVESADSRKGTVVVGLGINVNNSMRNAPTPLPHNAIALCDVAERPLVLIDLLIDVLQHLAVCFKSLGTGEINLRKDWRERCLLTGCAIRVDQGNDFLEGTCLGIDQEGALLVETNAGRRRCLSGVVTKLE